MLENKKWILKCLQKCKGNPKQSQEGRKEGKERKRKKERNRVEGLIISDFKTDCKTTISKQYHVNVKDRHRHKWNRTDSSEETDIHMVKAFSTNESQ